MKLKELFEGANFDGCVTVNLVEDGVNYQFNDGYDCFTVENCNGFFPSQFLPYAENEVVKVFPAHEYVPNDTPDEQGRYHFHGVNAIGIQILAVPSENICEVFYTGGNIWCGVCRVADGWFMGATNESGGIWKTYSQALESYPEDGCGFIRDVVDTDELKRIWTHIYETNIANGTETEMSQELLGRLDSDLAELKNAEEG